MGQVRFDSVLIVVLLEMMYFILVFVVTMMSWSETKVRQLFPILRVVEEGSSRDAASMLGVEEIEDLNDG